MAGLARKASIAGNAAGPSERRYQLSRLTPRPVISNECSTLYLAISAAKLTKQQA